MDNSMPITLSYTIKTDTPKNSVALTKISFSSGKGINQIDEASFSLALSSEVTLGGKVYILDEIGPDVFKGNTYLTAITIPSTVRKISDRAFCNCKFLSTVYFDDNSELKTIGNKAFEGTNIKGDFTFPESVEELGSECFKDSLNGTNLYFPNLKIAKSKAFAGCLMHSVEIKSKGNKISTLGMFENCSLLTSAYLNDINIKTISSKMFFNCISLTSVTLPQGTKKIGEDAFSGCVKLNSISNIESIESIGSHAFLSCTHLNIDFAMMPHLKTIKSFAFDCCEALSSVEFNDECELISLDSGAFWGCTQLEYVNLNNKVKCIPVQAFSCCCNLNRIEGIDCVETIKRTAFSSTNIKKLRFSFFLKDCDASAFYGMTNAEIDLTYTNLMFVSNIMKITGIDDNTFIVSPGTKILLGYYMSDINIVES